MLRVTKDINKIFIRIKNLKVTPRKLFILINKVSDFTLILGNLKYFVKEITERK